MSSSKSPDIVEMLSQIRSNAPSDNNELRETFIEAIEHMSKTKTALSEETQRRLFGLFHRAQASPTDKMEEEQKAAVAAESHLTREEAMKAYVDLVEAKDPTFLFDEEAEGPSCSKEKPLSEMPKALLEQLEAGGIKMISQAEAEAAELNVFEAARAGSGLARHLPAGALATDEMELTALHHAVDAEQLSAAKALLQAKADPNAVDADGSTPLHYAITIGSVELVQLLVESGADRAIKDEDGNDAAMLAKSLGQTKLEPLLASGSASSSSSSSAQ